MNPHSNYYTQQYHVPNKQKMYTPDSSGHLTKQSHDITVPFIEPHVLGKYIPGIDTYITVQGAEHFVTYHEQQHRLQHYQGLPQDEWLTDKGTAERTPYIIPHYRKI